jgi:hypothetical protein
MEVKLTVPTSLSEITLGQYQRFKRTADKFEETNDFLLQKMIECFCNVQLIHVLLIQRKSVLEVTAGINNLFHGKYELQPTFKIKDVEFGFIPNLDNISQGEYVDLDNYITNWEDMHKAMAVLFRPIKDKKGDKYTIHDYQGTEEFADLMKYMPLDVALGAYVFFCHLGNELLISTLEFLRGEAVEMISQHKDSSALNGDGIIQYINSLTAKYGELMKSQENPFTSVLHFSPIK